MFARFRRECLPLSEREPPSSLKHLGARLDKARADASPPQSGDHGSERANGLSAGFQVATELVVAMIVAVAIGWFLDEWLETRPVFLVIFFFLGAAAGALNVYRRAQQIIGVGTEHSAKPPEQRDKKG
jgi:ATP synthase protein I